MRIKMISALATLDEIADYDKRLPEGPPFGSAQCHKTRLSNRFTLYHFIEDHFKEVDTEFKRLCSVAIKRFGPEGWRKVSFEAVGLWVAENRYQLKKVEK